MHHLPILLLQPISVCMCFCVQRACLFEGIDREVAQLEEYMELRGK